MRSDPKLKALSLVVGDLPSCTSNANEFKIVRRIVQGECEEFRYFVAEYKDQIFSMLIRMTGDHGIAEDLTQEVFVRAFRSLPGFRFESSFKTWITRIALNHANSYFQSAYYLAKRRLDPFDPVTHDYSEDKSPETEAVEAFRYALSEIPESFREVLVLCVMEGRTYEEVAGMLSIPIGTVRSRLNRGRIQLKNILMRRE